MDEQLHFPAYSFKIRNTANGKEIYDIVRKKYVALTPEEWVRQHVIMYLIEDKGVPIGRIKIEKVLKFNKLYKRADVVVYGDNLNPLVIVECKAPSIKLNTNVFEQIACYNMALKVKHLLVTNGLSHFYCTIDFENNQFTFESNLPSYQNINL